MGALVAGLFLLIVPPCPAVSDGPGEADLPDPTRQELRRQLYLYNGWIQDVVEKEFNVDSIRALQLPVARILPAFRSQLADGPPTADFLATRRELLSRWIELLSTTRLLRPGDPRGAEIGQRLPASAVGLRFGRAKAGSNLVQDFRQQADAYERIRDLVAPLNQQYAAISSRFDADSDKTLNYAERQRRFQASKDVADWGDRVSQAVEPIEREAATLGYPVTSAWNVLESIGWMKKNLHAMKDVPGAEPPAQGFAQSPPCELVNGSLAALAKDGYWSGRLCSLFSTAYSDMPPGLDPQVIELAWGLTVPISEPTRDDLIVRLKLAEEWLAAVGLAQDVKIESLNLWEPNQIGLSVAVSAGYWAARRGIRPAPPIDGPDREMVEIAPRRRLDPAPPIASPRPAGVDMEDRIFYKLAADLDAAPSAMSLTIHGDGTTATLTLVNGRISNNSRMLTSETARSELKIDGLRTSLANVALSGNVSDVASGIVSSNIRVTLARYLATFRGKVAVVQDEPGFLLVRVHNARNMVVGSEDLWEDVEINLIHSHQDQKLRFVCVIDGRWAPGLLAPRSLEAFRDMEPRYSKQLNEFASQLLIRLKDDLARPATKAGPR